MSEVLRGRTGEADWPPIRNMPISQAAEQLWAEIEQHDLARHIAELEVRGFTVVPPEKVAPRGFAERLLERALALVERRTGIRLTPEMTEDSTCEALKAAFGYPMNYVLLEEPLFQEALLNPVSLAFTTYMLGENALLSSATVLVKGPGGVDLPLHADTFRMPDPLPSVPHIGNITWALTDYTRENGALAVVPGSHRYLRRPLENEGLAERIPVEAKAGSLIIWGGQLWHGAYARTAPGFRATLTMYLCRPHMVTQEAYARAVPREIIAQRPRRFGTLLGQNEVYGWDEKGPVSWAGVDEGRPDINQVGRHVYD